LTPVLTRRCLHGGRKQQNHWSTTPWQNSAPSGMTRERPTVPASACH